MMEPVREAVVARFREVELRPPNLPNVTGTWLEPEQATDPEYWGHHLVSTVRFAANLTALWREPEAVLLEVGPGRTLGALALQHPESRARETWVVVSSLPGADHGRRESAHFVDSLGTLWLAGAADIRWQAFNAGARRRRVELPSYPLERRRVWIDPPEPEEGIAGAAPESPLRAAVWVRSARPAPAAIPRAGVWLLLTEPSDLSEHLVARLRDSGHMVREVRSGPGFACLAGRRFTVDPGEPQSFEALLGELLVEGLLPERARQR